MSHVLNAVQRRHLDGAVQKARTIAERAARDALRALAVAETSRPSFLGDDENALRIALREKARQLGDDTQQSRTDLNNLVRDVAYEQWHRLLFARFLEVNGLLRHPEFLDTSLTLADCADLADDLGEPDGWSVAARFASEILPGVFRLADPAVKVRFATEHRLELERILLSIQNDIFLAEDALGWVYQFWQTAEKKRVYDSGVKVGGANLSAVTQLFTEDYMVRFLLENSLGAWWAARHPNSPLLEGWKYLRRLDNGTPAAGSFADWPEAAAEVTVIDPCCGSGHFLVALFGMLWRMRAEEEGLSAPAAQDAVLQDNLHGLELDPRCTQIATFNVALEAWKQGGFRDLPAPRIACSGVPVRASRAEWEAFAGDNDELRRVLARLHDLFRNADTLGSLISPQRAEIGEDLFGRSLRADASWDAVIASLANALRFENQDASVLGYAAGDVVHAAALLSSTYTLVATNPPYLQRGSMDALLQEYIASWHPRAKADIATAFIERCLEFVGPTGTVASVSPQNWLLLRSYLKFREVLLGNHRVDVVARLGAGAFRQISGEVVKVSLSVISAPRPHAGHQICGLLAHRIDGVQAKAGSFQLQDLAMPKQSDQLRNPDHRITLARIAPKSLLEGSAEGLAGLQTGDYPRFGRNFWELPLPLPDWEHQQSTVRSTCHYGGREHVIHWCGGNGALQDDPGAVIRSKASLGKRGVAISQMGSLAATLYTGELFDNNTAVILPKSDDDLPAIWAYCSSPDFGEDVRDLDDQLKVTNATLVKVAFDRDR